MSKGIRLRDWEADSRSFVTHADHILHVARRTPPFSTFRINEDGEELDELRSGVPDQIEWVDASIMLMDALTKAMNAKSLAKTSENH